MRRKNRFVTLILTALTGILAIAIVFSQVQKKQPSPPALSAPRGTANGGDTTARNRSVGNTAAQNTIPVRVTSVALGTIESSIIINGDVLSGKEVSIYPSVAGKLVSMRFKPGETVVQGQVLAVVDPSRPGEVYAQNPVVSTITGTVLSALANTGDTVSANTAVYTVGDVSNVVVEAFVPERFSAAIHEGLAASVSFEAIHGEFFAATVNEVSPALDPSSRTMRIRLRFTQKDARIKPGMFAQASLVTETRHSALIVPRSSVINTYGSFIVFIVDEENKAHQVEIGIGLESEAQIQAISGLKEGDRVVFEGQNFLTDGDAVRIVE
ncbi:MAG: efflux RND transporter periplasmic adaptor subunit [Treponema sp.]|jgi:multidrug efflux pump subunit AcrA (membrane-fusion protein)|nr:efflux RND transporter periplasmic adaptor subunit [Treponema sp.]